MTHARAPARWACSVYLAGLTAYKKNFRSKSAQVSYVLDEQVADEKP